MIKLIKLEDLWYTDINGTLLSRDEPTEDLRKWTLVKTIPQSIYSKLRGEFPVAISSFSADNEGRYGTDEQVGEQQLRHVIKLVPEGEVFGDKYVTYHVTHAMKA